jgi:DNA-binding MarR family transcriptional regulator
MIERNNDPTDLIGQVSEQFTRAFRRLRAGTAKELAPFGITFSQARVLRVIGRAEGPLRIGDLASKLEIAPRSATGMVDALEGARLAVRRPDAVDRRSVFVELTAEGRNLLAHMAEARRESAEQLFGRLTVEQRSQLLALLDALNGAEAPAPAPESEVR